MKTDDRGTWDVQVGQMENDLWFVNVVVDGESRFRRPGFRTREDAGDFGWQWVQHNLDEPNIEIDNRKPE